MKIIIYVTKDKRDGIQVRFRDSKAPVFHLMESKGFETVEDAINYGTTFQRGAEAAGAKTILALDTSVADVNDTLNAGLPTYNDRMKIAGFKEAWKELKQ